MFTLTSTSINSLWQKRLGIKINGLIIMLKVGI